MSATLSTFSASLLWCVTEWCSFLNPSSGYETPFGVEPETGTYVATFTFCLLFAPPVAVGAYCIADAQDSAGRRVTRGYFVAGFAMQYRCPLVRRKIFPPQITGVADIPSGSLFFAISSYSVGVAAKT